MKNYYKLVVGIALLALLTGCVTNLAFVNRPSFETVLEARNIQVIEKRPIAIKWWPPTFPEMRDMQSSKSGDYNSASNVVIPTSASLASRILELLDASVGINDLSNEILRIAVFVAESKVEVSTVSPKYHKTIIAASCVFEAEFILGNKAWTKKFFSERRNPGLANISQTVVLEKVWDDIALQVAKSVASNI